MKHARTCQFHCLANHGMDIGRRCLSSHAVGTWEQKEHFHSGWTIFGNKDCDWRIP